MTRVPTWELIARGTYLELFTEPLSYLPPPDMTDLWHRQVGTDRCAGVQVGWAEEGGAEAAARPVKFSLSRSMDAAPTLGRRQRVWWGDTFPLQTHR